MKVTQKTHKEKRKLRVRKKILGTKARPRLTVFRSNKYIYGQLIDDESGTTLISTTKDTRKLSAGKNKSETAFLVGKALAEAALQKKIAVAIFDRGPYKYHGRVKSFAEGAREGGLNL